MAGNRRIYEAAIRRAESQAGETKWSEAISSYRDALSEYPDDLVALAGLGLSYIETEQPEKALDAYRRAASLAPDNPRVIVHLAQALVRLGRWPEAARVYVQAAKAGAQLNDLSSALELFQKAALMDPRSTSAHQGLAEVYERQGETRKAAWHRLVLARVLERRGRHVQAIEQCGAAQHLDANNPEAMTLLKALKQGAELPDGPTARLQLNAQGRRTLESFVVFEDIELDAASLLSEWGHHSPADMALQRALSQMADAVFSGGADSQAMQRNVLLGQGADYHTRGMPERAISAYTDAIRHGGESATLHFALGLLYRDAQDYARAIDHLGHALSEPNLKLGARFAIGESYYAWNRTAVALEHLLESLHLIDAHTVSASRSSELSVAYARLRQDYVAQGESETVRRFAQSILAFLRRDGWGNQVVKIRKQLNSLASGGILVTLAETLIEPRAEVATTALCQIQDYLDRKLYFSALEECYWAIHQTPYFLPLHLHMAEVLIAKGQIDAAVRKYVVTAESYLARAETQRAMAVYGRALEIAPMDVHVRETLISLLLENKQFDAALEQYLSLADTCYQLAQVDRALAKLDEALTYANQGDPADQWQFKLMHRVGDMHAQRLDWRQAIRAYRRIKQTNVDDPRARSMLVDLYFKSGQRDQAFRELDGLLELHEKHGQSDQIVATLQDVLRSRPDDLELHLRLARVYVDQDKNQEAIAELDAVGKLQLGMGQTRAAQRTIQAILRLGPDNVDGYRQLLTRLSSR